MMEKTNQITSMSDKTIIQFIGNYIRHQRLKQNKTQSQLAHTAGVNRSTVSQIENGEPITLSSLIQVLRALDCLSVFTSFEIRNQLSPIALAKLEKKQRLRARNKGDHPQTENEW